MNKINFGLPANFLFLPREIHLLIASRLNNQDFCSYRILCKKTFAVSKDALFKDKNDFIKASKNLLDGAFSLKKDEQSPLRRHNFSVRKNKDAATFFLNHLIIANDTKLEVYNLKALKLKKVISLTRFPEGIKSVIKGLLFHSEPQCIKKIFTVKNRFELHVLTIKNEVFVLDFLGLKKG